MVNLNFQLFDSVPQLLVEVVRVQGLSLEGILSMSNHNNHGHDHIHDSVHEHTILGELMCHLPYGIFSVALGLCILSFLTYLTYGTSDVKTIRSGAKVLFHSFHFLHIVFASTGTLIAFFRFSQNVWRGILVSIFTTIVFCTLSDAVLPYLAGRILEGNMHFHLCFFTELKNVLPFLTVGLLNGVVMGKYHRAHGGFYSSVFSHFFHILISSFASLFYLIYCGMVNWSSMIGLVFLFLVIAVVVPCTLSDVVIPMAAARSGKKNERD